MKKKNLKKLHTDEPTPRKEESLPQLIKEAVCMYSDRSKEEIELIYYVAKMTDIERQALILAYQFHQDDW